ncbi:serine hydrolase domain-containing protein [Bacillus niameyensis]|uniref:serine hydrolase domain-containing protein n=1 Tax=Bacillus niameyensis TaxID=1522308 RepID=UPI000A51B42D|nr:serine hydrolase domain-containing protein [Bacillus niameyensis]
MLDRNDNLKKKVQAFLEKEVELGIIPGAALHISQNGKTIMDTYVGSRTFSPSPEPVQQDTIYDLASLTKIVATLTAMLQLLDEGFIHLKDRISRFFPSFENNGKGDITIKQLLTHTSGLPAHRPYYAENLNREQVIERICNEDLQVKPDSEVIYSDLGFILLAALIEKVVEQPFQQYVDEQIFTPLEMNDTGFNLAFDKQRFAATEFSESLKDYKYGIVHDENAESMGGISGHAGLFSTLGDLAKYASMVENNGFYNGKQIISSQSLKLSRENFTTFDNEGRGLGWQLQSKGVSACGDLFSAMSYGHTGFTGTSIWFDPEVQLSVILLTNRVHIPHQLGILRLRPRLHNLIRSHF